MFHTQIKVTDWSTNTVLPHPIPIVKRSKVTTRFVASLSAFSSFYFFIIWLVRVLQVAVIDPTEALLVLRQWSCLCAPLSALRYGSSHITCPFQPSRPSDQQLRNVQMLRWWLPCIMTWTIWVVPQITSLSFSVWIYSIHYYESIEYVYGFFVSVPKTIVTTLVCCTINCDTRLFTINCNLLPRYCCRIASFRVPYVRNPGVHQVIFMRKTPGKYGSQPICK